MVWSCVVLVWIHFKPQVVSSIKSSESTESFLIRFENDEMVTGPIGANCVILERLICMEVENEYQVSLLVHNDLISFILLRYVLMRLYHGTEGDLYLVHLFVKSIKVTISQVFIVHEIPLTTAILITISVSFSWEINPLWMTELVTHEVKVGLTTEWLWNQSNHLMKSHSSSY